LIDDLLASGIKSGYTFVATAEGTGTPKLGYVSSAIPTKAGQTGQRGFCSDQSGVLRAQASGTAQVTKSSDCEALGALQ
jgi:hypothetical protein